MESNGNEIVLVAGSDFKYNIYGWEITTPPPPITQPGDFATSPSPMVELQTSSCQVFPTQAYTFSHLGEQSPNLTATSFTGKVQGDHWTFWYGQEFAFDLSLPSAVNVGLTLTIAAPTGSNGTTIAGYQVIVNGKTLVNTADKDPGWHPVLIPIPASVLVAGKNVLQIVANTMGYGLWLQSIQVGSDKVPLKAQYFWQQLGATQVYPGDNFSRGFAVTNGCTNTQSETTSFAGTIGVAVDIGGLEGMLAGITAKLSASFTMSKSGTKTVSVTKSTTSSYTSGISLPADSKIKSITWQLWQLCLQFEANGVPITQAFGPSKGPIIVTQFKE